MLSKQRWIQVNGVFQRLIDNWKNLNIFIKIGSVVVAAASGKERLEILVEFIFVTFPKRR
jgi:hypothetical protein